MDTLAKSLDSFSSRHANTAFFRAINPDMAADILSGSSVNADQLESPLHLTTSLTHAQHYVPHWPVVEFLLKPGAKVLDMRFHPKSERGTWDATLPDETDAEHPLGRSGLVGEGLADAMFHELSDVLEVHQHAILTPVRLHQPVQPYVDEAPLSVA